MFGLWFRFRFASPLGKTLWPLIGIPDLNLNLNPNSKLCRGLAQCPCEECPVQCSAGGRKSTAADCDAVSERGAG